MYRVEYYCPRSGRLYWQPLRGGFLNLMPQSFPSFEAAVQTANSLMWRYHSTRVVDPTGQVVYQV
jgi:hypothetical protein